MPMIAFAANNKDKKPGAKDTKPDPAELKLQELQIEMHRKWAAKEPVALGKKRDTSLVTNCADTRSFHRKGKRCIHGDSVAETPLFSRHETNKELWQ
jgi:hypothetical protein